MFNRKRRWLFISLVLVLVAVFFQNCGTSFSSASINKKNILGLNSTSGNTPTDPRPSDPIPPPVPAPQPTPNPPPMPPPVVYTIDDTTPACTESEFAGFLCLKKTFVTSEGQSYNVTLRWNRIKKESAGTVMWVLGGDGRGNWRKNFPDSKSIQNDFDTVNSIRSIEVDFTDAPTLSEVDGGYWKYHKGYYSAANAYMEVVKFISANLKKGNFLNHVVVLPSK